jgi:hypothetical protein
MSRSRNELEVAYGATDYRVEDAPSGPFVIRIGQVCADVNEEWAFVTACNPRSERLSDEKNSRRMAELEAVVQVGGWTYYHGQGIGSDGRWPAEPSLLVVGISEADAIALGKRFGQNAVVVGRVGEAARLAWTA